MRVSCCRERIAWLVAVALITVPEGAFSRTAGAQAVTPDQRDVSVSFDDQPTLTVGPLTVRGLARFQIDWQHFAERDGEWTLHRARVGVEGRLFRIVEYQVERELSDDTDAWRDVYVDVAAASPVQVRAGRFKIPFSLDELTSATELDFVYRSLAGSNLAPGRDLGAGVHGRLFDKRLRYDAGVFRQGGENVRASERTDPSSDRTIAARVAYTPQRNARKSVWRDLTVGGGLTRGDLPVGLNSVAGRTVADEPFFPRLYVSGQRQRFGADLNWRTGPIGIRAEVMRVLDDRRGQSTDDTDLPRVRADGAYVSGSWVITGEDKTDAVRPRRSLFQGGIGAVEVAARLERLAFRSTAEAEPSGGPRAAVFAPPQSNLATLGVNWYLNRFVRLQVNIVREHRLESGGISGGNTSWNRVFRIQFGV